MLVCKVLIILQLAPQLFKAHWYWTSYTVPWFNVVNYWLFTAILVGSLILIGLRARPESSATIWKFSTAASVIGVSFAVMLGAQCGRNYLDAYMLGLLDFASLRYYFVLDFFFAKPYLGAYLVTLGIGFWISFRLKKETWNLFLLAALCGCYLGFNQESFDIREAKWMQLNCLGIAGFATCLTIRKRISWRALAVPLVLVTGWWGAFHRFSPELITPNPYLVLLVALSVALFLPAVISLRSEIIFESLSHFLPFYILSFFLLVNSNYVPSQNYDMFFAWSLAAPGYLLSALVLVVCLSIAAFSIGRRTPQIALGLFDLAAIALLLASLVDVIVLHLMGVRLDWNLLTMSDDVGKTWNLVRPHLLPLLLGLFGLSAAYWGMIYVLNSRIHVAPTRSYFLERPTLVYLSIGFGLIALLTFEAPGFDNAIQNGFLRVALSSPWVKNLESKKWTAAQLLAHARTLDINARVSANSVTDVPAARTNLNVVLVIMESSYNKHLSLFGSTDETEPFLSKFRDRMELFPNIFSVFPSSLHARFSIYNGLYPTVEFPSYLNPHIRCPSIFEILHDAGYTTELYYSSTRNYTRMNDYLSGRKIDLFEDCDTMPGREKYPELSWGVPETATMEAMKDRIRFHAKNGDSFFLSYIPAAPHQPFERPPKQFQVFDDSVSNIDKNYLNAYKNQLLYMDWILSSLIEQLKESGLLNKTLVLITNDHGEMLGDEQGFLGHGWRLKPELCNTPLIVMDPRHSGARINTTIGSEVDILPTVLDLLNIPLPANQIYQGLSLYDPRAKNPRPIYIQSFGDRAMVLNGEYYWIENCRDGMTEAQALTRRFSISNVGARTIFTELPTGQSILSRHLEFEKYQHSFVYNYAHYRDLMLQSLKKSKTLSLAGRQSAGARTP